MDITGLIEQFNITDWVIVALFVVSIIVGLYRGLIKELGTLVIWIAAFVLAMMFYKDFSIFLSDYIKDPRILKIVSIVILILAVIFVGGILNMILGYLVKSSGLSGIDKMFGGVFGFLRAGVLIGLVAVALDLFHLQDNDYISKSQLLPQLKPYGEWVYELIPQAQRTWIEEQIIEMEKDNAPATDTASVTVTSGAATAVTTPVVSAIITTTPDTPSVSTSTTVIEGEPLPAQSATIFDQINN